MWKTKNNDNLMDSPHKSRIFSLPELMFISLMAGCNVLFDFLLSPAVILLLGHVIAGIFIMVPINFIFLSFTKHFIDQFGSLFLYMLIFSVIAVPTTFYGAFPGLYKVIAGAIVGLFLDLAYILKKPLYIKLILGGLFGAIAWWLGTFIVWHILGYPFVTGMSNLLNEFINLTNIISIPITRINWDFLIFTGICGCLSSVPSIVMSILTYPIVKTIKATILYEKFTSFE